MVHIGNTTPRPSAWPSTACRIRRLAGLLIPSLLTTSLACRDATEPAPTTAEPGAPALAAGATAGHRTVNSLADPGDGICNAAQCTLREALADPGSTDISFASGLTGAVTLATPQSGGGTLVIRKSVTVAGPRAGITIRRRATDRQFRILTIESGVTVTLADLTLRNGKTDRVGGGIVNFGTLTLRNCTVAGNASSQHGGGIDNHGPLTLEHTTVANNSAVGGGGIDNHGMTLTVAHSSIVRNAGSGIASGGGTLAITNTAVSYNSGRGISVDWGRATLEKVRILGNSGGGLALHQGTIALTNSTVSRNSSGSGAGITNSAGGKYTIANSTISNNAASALGGGIFNTVGDPFGRLSASVRLTNSTVSGNSAGSGGGIENSDRLGGAFVTVINSTIASNSARETGGGIDVGTALESSNIVSLVNSLVALNTAPTARDVTGGAAASFSLIGDGAGSGLTNSDGNQVGNVSPYTSRIDPMLGPLADNGGPTATRALEAGSPAIDAASGPACPAADQRGVPRPQGAACDIGSYERE